MIMTDTRKPLVSVFMVAYNSSKFIEEAIESVLNQEDFSDYELVIGDDASTDGTQEIIRSYQDRYPDKIKAYFNPVNVGVTINCNQLLKKCSGKYITSLDGDDVMYPNKLKVQTDVMLQNPNCVFSYHDVLIFGDVKTETTYYGGAGGKKPFNTKNGDISLLIRERNYVASISVMMKKECIPEHGFHPDIPKISDWLFLIELAAQGDTLYINQVLGKYRRHGSSITSSYNDIDDFELTYAILENEFPSYKHDIQCGKARLYLSYAILYMIRKQPAKSLKTLSKALKLSFSSASILAFVIKSFFTDCVFYSGRFFAGWRF